MSYAPLPAPDRKGGGPLHFDPVSWWHGLSFQKLTVFVLKTKEFSRCNFQFMFTNFGPSMCFTEGKNNSLYLERGVWGSPAYLLQSYDPFHDPLNDNEILPVRVAGTLLLTASPMGYLDAWCHCSVLLHST